MTLGERVRLISNSLFNMTPPMVSAVMGLATVSLQLAFLPSESYALWISLHAIIATMSMIDFGMGWSLTYIVAGDSALERSDTRRVLNGSAAVVIILGLIGGLVVFGLALVTAAGLKLSPVLRDQTIILALSAALIFLTGRITLYAISILYGLRQFAYSGTLAASQTLAIGTSTIACAYFTHSVLAIALWHVFIAILFTGLGLIMVARMNSGLRFRPSFVDIPNVFSLTRFSMASQCADLANAAIWDICTLALGFLIGPSAVVAFHVGIRIPKTISSVLVRSAEVMMPMGSASEKDARPDTDRQMILEGIRWNLIIAIPASAIIFAMAPYILDVWLHRVDPDMLAVLRIVIAAVVIDAMGMAILYFAWGRGVMSLVLGATIGQALIGIVAVTVLVPEWGVTGAAIGMLIGAGATTLWLTRQLPAKAQRLGDGMRAILSGLILPGVVSGLVACSTQFLFDPPSVAGLAAAIASGLITFYGLFFTIGAHPDERLLAYTFCQQIWRQIRPLIKQIRGLLAHIRPLRSFWHALIEIAARVSGTWQHESGKSDNLFSQLSDPWGYERDIHQNRLRRAEFLVDSARRSAGISLTGGRILEIGCAEGNMTERLVGRAREIESLDISLTAIARATKRVSKAENIRFSQCDITKDTLPAGYDLVIVDGILDYFRSRRLLAELAEKIRTTVRPGGFILLGNTRQHRVIEEASWARWLVRGGLNVNRYVAQQMGYNTVAEDNDAFYSYILVQRLA